MTFLVWLTMGVALIAYVVTAGADFGGGIWDLLARRKEREREAIERAIAPIWEANHVWLIFIIVVMFTAFPRAFRVVSVAFHIPLVLVLVGIVLRGAGFVFRAYGLTPGRLQATYGHAFAWASLFTPLCMGLVLGGMSSGAITLDGDTVTSGFVAGWTSPFAIAVGVFTLATFALLAAVYMTLDAPLEITETFRKRALICEALCAIAAALTLALSPELLRQRFTGHDAFWPIQATCALAAGITIWSLVGRRYHLARLSVISQMVFVVVGWGVAMRNEVVLGAVDIYHAGANADTLRLLVPTIGAGALLLIPSLVLLMRIFKASSAAPEEHRDGSNRQH